MITTEMRLRRRNATCFACFCLVIFAGMMSGAAPGRGDPLDQPDGEHPAAAAPAPQQTASAGPRVDINNFDFSPMTLTITAGTAVTWTNHDDIPHTVVSSNTPPLFKSPPLDTDDTFSATFAQPGTYTYFCSVHPKMVGTIIVKPK